MGHLDSTRTRVTPFFSALTAHDDEGTQWLEALLALPFRDGSRPPAIASPPVLATRFKHDGEAECTLPSPPGFLRWLVDNPQVLREPIEIKGLSEKTRLRRNQLLAGDAAARADAIAMLDRNFARGWHVFEGPSRPDVLIETRDAIIVVEGKRTEGGPTDDIRWLRQRRDQMLRHLDCAWAWPERQGRTVYGLYLVEGDAVPQRWRDVAKATTSSESLRDSLPHRSDAEKEAIASAFLGVATWGQLAKAMVKLGIEPPSTETVGDFRFKDYTAHEARVFGKRLVQTIRANWTVRKTAAWTEMILDWFAAASAPGVLVNARTSRGGDLRGVPRAARAERRNTDGEWLLDMVHSSYPHPSGEASLFAYWQKVLDIDRPCHTYLALESEWGRAGDASTSRAMILEDASKIATFRADLKVMITGTSRTWTDDVRADLKKLRELTRDPAPWLWIDVPNESDPSLCDFDVFE